MQHRPYSNIQTVINLILHTNYYLDLANLLKVVLQHSLIQTYILSIEMQHQVANFIEEVHLLKSILTTNSRIASPQTLTVDLSLIPQLITVYRENEDSKGLRERCLTERSYSAAKFMRSLKLMEDQEDIIYEKPLKLVQPKIKTSSSSQNVVWKTETTKLSKKQKQNQQQNQNQNQNQKQRKCKKSRQKQCQRQQQKFEQQPLIEYFLKPKVQNKQLTNKSQSNDSGVSPIFTEIIAEDQPVRRKVQRGKSILQSQKSDSNSNILPKFQISYQQSREENNILRQFFIESQERDYTPATIKDSQHRNNNINRKKNKVQMPVVRQFSPLIIVSDPVTERQPVGQSEEHSFMEHYSKQEEDQQLPQHTQLKLSKPLKTQQTYLNSSPANDFNNSNQLSSSGYRKKNHHLNISPQIVNIHQVLRAARTSRSRDSDRQRYMIEFNSKVEDELKGIKEELREIKNTQHQLSASNISQLQAQSRITSKATFNPRKQQQSNRSLVSQTSRQKPKTLKFDLSKNSSSAPKPMKQLLTISRAVNVRGDSRPVRTSTVNTKQQKLFSSRLSNQKKRQQKSLENFQKSMRLVKPKRKELLTTRIAKYT